MVYFKAVKSRRGSFPTSFKSSCSWSEVGNGCGALEKTSKYACCKWNSKVKSGTYCVPKSSAGGWKCRGHPFSREYGEELEVTREYLNWVHTDVYWKDEKLGTVFLTLKPVSENFLDKTSGFDFRKCSTKVFANFSWLTEIVGLARPVIDSTLIGWGHECPSYSFDTMPDYFRQCFYTHVHEQPTQIKGLKKKKSKSQLWHLYALNTSIKKKKICLNKAIGQCWLVFRR